VKPVSVRELRNEFPKLASSLEEGEKILLTRHSKPIAKVTPIQEEITETVDWSTSAAFQLTRSGQVLSRERGEEVLAEYKGDC